jgi:tetratricopeptide (TPR) repeat protein
VADPVHRTLKLVAVALTVVFVAWAVYDSFGGRAPGDVLYLDGNTSFEHGDYAKALDLYERALERAPDHLHALRGVAASLHLLGRHDDALAVYDEAIRRDPEFGAAYANRGILNDRMGRHQEALLDYQRALLLDPGLADGPHWLTRFLRNQAERPSTIADRALYLRAQLALPEGERLLLVPEIDDAQRPYRM